MSRDCASGPKNDTKNSASSVTVSAPGKIILHGEHSVVYGKLALAASLGLRSRVTIKETDSSSFMTISLTNLNCTQKFGIKDLQDILNASTNFQWSEASHEELLKNVETFCKNLIPEILGVDVFQAFTSFLYLFVTVFCHYKVSAVPLDISVATDLTIGAGLGSSASLLVAVSGALMRYCRSGKRDFDESDLKMISKWAFNAEKIFHGTPSGIDNTVCTYGSIVKFRKGSPPETLHQKHTLKMLLINTKVPKSTKALVAKVASLKRRYPAIVDPIFAGMEGVTNAAIEVFNEMNDFNLGELFGKLAEITDLNQNLLRALGVSHKVIDEICRTLSMFDLHGKLTGAGGGGYCIALIPPDYDDWKLQKVADVLRESNYEVIVTDVGGPGISLD